ncbi:MAG: hypothetical protein CMF52_08420 [Legionellales bacterium]|nr:hypothetical protein [Legionellales bacterium]|tara:strand:- start:803 stop:1228 length:426 start_codon:yes stop_codon:yes gene_type:complete
MPAANASTTYLDIGQSNAVKERGPEELITLLLQRACVAIKRSVLIIGHKEMDSEDWEVRLRATEEFNMSISKALQIVTALREVLDHQSGGELANQLHNTYTAIMASLWKSSKERNTEELTKLLGALTELRDAWQAVEGQTT